MFPRGYQQLVLSAAWKEAWRLQDLKMDARAGGSARRMAVCRDEGLDTMAEQVLQGTR